MFRLRLWRKFVVGDRVVDIDQKSITCGAIGTIQRNSSGHWKDRGFFWVVWDIREEHDPFRRAALVPEWVTVKVLARVEETSHEAE